MLPAVALRAPAARVLLAVISAVTAFALTRALDLERLPFLLPMLAVLLSALYAGFIAGLLAGTVTILLVSFALLPTESIRVPSATGAYHIAMFAVVATAISLLASRRSRAEANLQATLASMGDGVIVTDVDGRVIFLNGVAEHLTGWTAKAAHGELAANVFKPTAEPCAHSARGLDAERQWPSGCPR